MLGSGRGRRIRGQFAAGLRLRMSEHSYRSLRYVQYERFMILVLLIRSTVTWPKSQRRNSHSSPSKDALF